MDKSIVYEDMDEIHPWAPKELTFQSIMYLERFSYQVLSIRWAVFDEISLDNAPPHLSIIVVENLIQNLNYAFNDGPSGTPEIRGVVERFFGVLEETGMYRLRGTTGSNQNDKRCEKIKGDCIDR
ncbi:hypothetical protein [Marinomonas balearica]|uniref:hypothetical protein n=1 Tax=Marinomonas balearica TaxID=491947 RepID=UPI00105CC2E1|nr:hypothetical protein [Marinomonas balearica]